MSTRTLLCVEPDDGSVAVIRRALEPYGFEVRNIANGEQAIDWARQNRPDLIIVCVEPRKIGYAICSKIRRSPDLMTIPLILTSAEETQHTFDQHKKLKARADEYVLKPLTTEELLAKVGALLPLGEPLPGADDPSEEIAIAEGDLVAEDDLEEAMVENTASVPIPLDPAPESAHASSADQPFSGSELDSIFDQETDAAFAALQTGASIPAFDLPPSDFDDDVRGQPATVIAPSPVMDVVRSDWEVQSTRAASMVDLANLSADPAGFGAHPDVDVPPSPDEISTSGLVPLAPPPVDDGRIRALEDRVNELEARAAALTDEKQRLTNDLDEARARLTSQPLSKEKEVLNLREIINRKEKDLLDLRDALDAKDRQILDHKDRMREQERARRDLEETMLGMEKTLMTANERVAALQHDKEKSLEREKGLKSRLDDAHIEITKAHDEVDTLKKRVAATEDKSRADLEKLRGDLEGRIRELEDMHRSEIARLSDEKVAAEESIERQYESKISQMTAAHAAEMEAREKKANEELTAAQDRASNEAARLRRDSEKALASAKEEQALQLAAERQAHQAATEAKERDHKNEILSVRRRQEEELRAAEERRQKELSEAEQRHNAELEAAEGRRRQDLQARDDEHQKKVAEMDRANFEEKTALAEQHRATMDQAHARAARAEGELAARTEELSETRRRLASVSGDLDATRADLRDREVKLSQSRDRVGELETKSAEYEDQILRAFQKLRADDKVIDRAKRALAVALTLLDERGAAPTTGAPAKDPGGRPTGEESPT